MNEEGHAPCVRGQERRLCPCLVLLCIHALALALSTAALQAACAWDGWATRSHTRPTTQQGKVLASREREDTTIKKHTTRNKKTHTGINTQAANKQTSRQANKQTSKTKKTQNQGRTRRTGKDATEQNTRTSTCSAGSLGRRRRTGWADIESSRKTSALPRRCLPLTGVESI